ncbi:glycosyltransferase [Microbulbifer sp. DLAB2-AF]|uniref:glycosyltransferase n=1 Tax=Microbulbifer sp. DLAB2-AF TaxID=3243395 RepID=UPI00403A6E84
MLKVIDIPEKLWQSCAELSKKSTVLESELFNTSNDHWILAYGPVAQRNQYQALLYSAHTEYNVSLLPIHKLDLCGEIPWPGKVICHFHWLHDNTKCAKTEDDANKAVVYWEKLIRRIKDNGHKIVWTVHNVMPHETVWIEQDKKIHQLVADAADSVHIMASDSVKQTSHYYSLNEKKTFLVPHPSYEGAQPDTISRDQARNQLGITSDDFVFLCFGAVMEYKGYDRLMKSYEFVRKRAKIKTRLIIAGLPTDGRLVGEIKYWASEKSDVILDMTPVPHDKLQVYFRSADLAVCPYYRTMNSGAAMMAITFNVPVLGPNSGGFQDLEQRGFGITFDNHAEDSLAKQMLLYTDKKNISLNVFTESKRSISPSYVSRLFFDNINKMVI